MGTAEQLVDRGGCVTRAAQAKDKVTRGAQKVVKQAALTKGVAQQPGNRVDHGAGFVQTKDRCVNIMSKV